MYEKLFSPVRIGQVAIKNRVAMTPMGVNLASAGGGVNDGIIAFYEARARVASGSSSVRSAVSWMVPARAKPVRSPLATPGIFKVSVDS